MASVIESVTAA